ncbi:MAG: hypothetical protein JWN76_101 [Chitinophagaceae bacterium]|nr:hypothetical protein [Chitinophagaceae bacterium]
MQKILGIIFLTSFYFLVFECKSQAPDIEWAKCYGTLNGNELGTRIKQTPDGGYVLIINPQYIAGGNRSL